MGRILFVLILGLVAIAYATDRLGPIVRQLERAYSWNPTLATIAMALVVVAFFLFMARDSH